jgi:chemotaxis protein MotB
MSLLMCFFVLLLSFATMDASKFRKMAESLENAFGVQRDIPATEIPMGTSIIAQHFSPAQTEPTPMEQIKQMANQESSKLDVSVDDMEKIKQKILEAKINEIEDQAEKIKQSLKQEIKQGLVSVGTEELKITIRINEKGSFSSGTAELKVGFEPIMKKITGAVNNSVGTVHVAGHTDNIPISNDWYRSNWELAASRSVTVAHFMLKNKQTDSARLVVQGFADTKPLVANNSAENRAKNRRVEIIITQDDPTINLKVDDISEILLKEKLKP